MLFGIKSEACNPFLGIVCAHGLKDPDRHHVLGPGQCRMQGHRTFEFTVVVLGLPRLAPCHAGIEKQGSVIDNGGRRKAFFQCRRINKGFETGAGLPPCLRAVIEFVLIEIKAADKRRIAPSRGSSATNAPSTSGSCVISQVFFGVRVIRITAPGRILIFGAALSDSPDCAGFL